MSRFFDRYLPRSERRAALWLAFGGAVAWWAGQSVGARVFQAVRFDEVNKGTPTWVAPLASGFASFLAAALVVGLLIRFARAPKALALYVVLGAALAIAFDVARLPLTLMLAALPRREGMFSPGVDVWGLWARGVVGDVAVALGAAAGAWIVQKVPTVERIRAMGFSAEGETKAQSGSVSTGWTFLGWEGRPVRDDALVAVAFVALKVLPTCVLVAGSYFTSLNPAFRGDFTSVPQAFWWGQWAVALGSWALAAFWVTRRTGVRSLWLAALGATGAAVLGLVEFAATLLLDGDPVSAGGQLLVGIEMLVPAAAALLGTYLALRREPATLSPNADTAGGTDG